MRLRLTLLITVLAGAAGAHAATTAELERVQQRIQAAAAPWCERLSARDAEGRKRCTIQVAVADVKGLANALSAFGGTWVTAEMLPHLSEDDLALVIGHEFAHLVLGHSLQRLQDADPTDPARRALLTWMEQTTVPPHDKAPADPTQHEFDADELGLYFAGLAGYSVPAMASFWAERAASIPASTLSLVGAKTHPSRTARAAALERVAAQFCKRVSEHQPLMPAAIHLQPHHEMAVDELVDYQRKLVPGTICLPPGKA